MHQAREHYDLRIRSRALTYRYASHAHFETCNLDTGDHCTDGRPDNAVRPPTTAPVTTTTVCTTSPSGTTTSRYSAQSVGLITRYSHERNSRIDHN